MSSTFTWLDYSEHERRKMLDVVKLFSERDTRDELGIGSVRDAFADLFFPGTSTIQTRARYFFFIPWIYLDLEKRRTEPGKIAGRARAQETELINALLESGETEGVIGRQAQDKLQRLPSNIYWQGLGLLSLRVFAGSQDQYHRSLAEHYTRLKQLAHHRTAEEFTDLRAPANWHPGLPSVPANFPKGVILALTGPEADYLRERLQTHARDSLFTFWASQKAAPPQSLFPWEVVNDQHSTQLREQLIHAQNFSEVIHGAALLYNLLLAEQKAHAEWVDAYRTRLAEWTQFIIARQSAFASWDKAHFWKVVFNTNPRVPRLTRVFVEQWLDVALNPLRLAQIADDAAVRDLIRTRERFLKRGQARLENQRALDLWNGASGTGRLDFRWGIAQRHLQDIHTGLNLL